MSKTVLGTVEILTLREYSLNPEDDVNTTTNTVIVQPSIYPLIEQDGRIFWEMTGEIRYVRPEPTFERVSGMQGTFIMRPPSATPTGKIVTFPSRSFTKPEFEDFRLNDPLVNPDSPMHRMNITLSA